MSWELDKIKTMKAIIKWMQLKLFLQKMLKFHRIFLKGFKWDIKCLNSTLANPTSRIWKKLIMNVKELIEVYFGSITSIAKIKEIGQDIKDPWIVDKILHIVTQKFDHIVIATEESRYWNDGYRGVYWFIISTRYHVRQRSEELTKQTMKV